MAQAPQVNKDTLSGRTFQGLRGCLLGVRKEPDLSLESVGFGQPRPAELILYCKPGISQPQFPYLQYKENNGPLSSIILAQSEDPTLGIPWRSSG